MKLFPLKNFAAGEMEKRMVTLDLTTYTNHMFEKCAVCGFDWGTCAHAGNNPVDVDNEAMQMIYAKLDMPVPVYPPSYVDFWYTRSTASSERF